MEATETSWRNSIVPTERNAALCILPVRLETGNEGPELSRLKSRLGSPTLAMKTVPLRTGTTEKPPEKQDFRPG
jgi:hypothetical protein